MSGTPALFCPFPSRISPDADALEITNLEWLEQLGLLSEKTEPMVERARFGYLAARAYPDAPFDLLRIGAAWATWLFLRDDQCDEGGISSDPVALRGLSDHQIEILSGKRPHREEDPLTAALSDLRERMLARGGGRWMSRFLANVQDYFDASVWEAENRARKRVPDVGTYARLRDLTGAVKTCFDIFELVEGSHSIDARYDTRLVAMQQLANRAICWSNDIFSVHKELAHGDVHNLVIVLQHESGMPLEEATAAACRMHDNAIRSFLRYERELREKDCTPELGKFVDALKGWVRANLDWSVETGRYAPFDADTIAS